MSCKDSKLFQHLNKNVWVDQADQAPYQEPIALLFSTVEAAFKNSRFLDSIQIQQKISIFNSNYFTAIVCRRYFF